MIQRPQIAITLGDPAGIGPEIIQKALAHPGCPTEADFHILGSPPPQLTPGQPSSEGTAIALQALIDSVDGLKAGRYHAVATAPISKTHMHAAGFAFPGHTEFYAQAFDIAQPTMCLSGPSLTVALVTTHIALADVPQQLTQSGIHRCIRDLSHYLSQKLRRPPRIAVAGLNPHAGEQGAFGKEEIELIRPAIDAIQHQPQLGTITGPHAPDTVFQRAAAQHFDGVVSLYHDQGLIPLKLLDFDRAINITLGLPIIRTSPDHGTAFDIAGQGIARETSMLAAIQAATQLAQCQQALEKR